MMENKDALNRLDLIRQRRSVRTFDGAAPDPEALAQLMDFAGKLENPYDIPIEWKLLDAKRDGLSSPVISGTDTYIAGKLRRVEHAEEAFGYAFEKLVLYALSLGLGTTWIAGTMDRAAFEHAMRLGPDEVMPCVSPLGRPAARMSLRETMMRKGIRADSRAAFETLFFDGSFDRPLTPAAAGKLACALEMVRLAPSAVNKQPWRVLVCGDTAHFYEKSSRGYTAGDGWDIQRIDMGIALCHFEIGAAESGGRVTLTVEDPGLPAEGLAYTASMKAEF